MIAGYSGSLVPHFYLEQQLAAASRPDAHRPFAAIRGWRRAAAGLGPASSVRAMYETGTAPLLHVIADAELRLLATSPSHVAAATMSSQPIAVITIAWGAALGSARQAAITTALAIGARWAVVFNGTHMRVADATHAYGRQYADIDVAVASADATTFDAASILVRAAGAPGDHTAASELDRIVALGRAAALDVCRALRNGVLTASGAITSALTPPRGHNADAAFEQALTMVYRVLFLLFAESRGLVPMWHPVYRASYSIDALRSAAERSCAPPGFWDGLRAISRLAHSGCRVGELRVAPFNGRLFSPARTPLVDRTDLDDGAAREAIVALTTTVQRGRRAAIPYRDLGVEQLGAVYETLLDYEPRIESLGRKKPRLTLEPGCDRRKTTGSFYTPQPLADYIVRRTLAPLVKHRHPDALLRLRILDPAMGSGAFLVAACRYVARAYERALVDAGDRRATDIDDQERAAIRRLVAERCLYGVDLNPMAVQLARLSLWLATLAADRPLTFLDHHLVTGNSLVGAWLTALRQPPRSGRRRRDRTLPLFDALELSAATADALPVRFSLEREPDDTLAQVRAKERALEALARPGTTLSRWKAVADAWCAAWFAGRSSTAIAAGFTELCDALVKGRTALRSKTIEGLWGAIARAAADHRFFHWELEFPEVFFGESGARNPNGGFDAVIGNPPWEMVRADSGDDRCDRRLALEAVVDFTRESGFYRAQSQGHANQYQMFVERAIALAGAGGRLGLIVPSGLMADAGSTALRDHLLSTCAIDAIVAFHNQQAIFPVHRSVRFLVLTATRGEPTRTIRCRFGERDARVLDTIGDDDQGLPLAISTDLVRRISPRDLSVPDFQSRVDIAIVERASSLFPPLADSWSVRFGRELNATEDREAFHARPSGLPVVEGKHIDAFRVDLDAVRRRISVGDARRLLKHGAFERRRLCYRDVAGAGNRITLIAAILPAGAVSVHTVLCLRTPVDDRGQQFLCGLFNSFVVNYLVRLRVGTHVTTAIVEALPIPTRDAAGPVFDKVAQYARVLARGDDPPTRAALNAAVAHLYQLTRDEFRHVLDTFPLVAREERDAALRNWDLSL